MSERNSTSVRVLRLPVGTKQAAQSARDAAKTSMRAWLSEATKDRLPALVEALRGLGFGAVSDEAKAKRKAARWVFDGDTLDLLRAASAETGLPQLTLLVLVIHQHDDTTPRSRKTRRRKTTPASKSRKAATRKTTKTAKTGKGE